MSLKDKEKTEDNRDALAAGAGRAPLTRRARAVGGHAAADDEQLAELVDLKPLAAPGVHLPQKVAQQLRVDAHGLALLAQLGDAAAWAWAWAWARARALA